MKALFPDEVKLYRKDPAILMGDLYEEEEVYIRNAKEKRRNEFRAGRLIARRLLVDFGVLDFPVLMGNKREPLWPDQITGSIAHTRQLCIVALAQKAHIKSVGVDVEQVGRIQENIWEAIFTNEEQIYLRSLPQAVRDNFVTLMFSAKESIYKCFYPIIRQWIGFQDVSIVFHYESCEFDAQFNTDLGVFIKQGMSFRGKYAVEAPLVITGICLRKDQLCE